MRTIAEIVEKIDVLRTRLRIVEMVAAGIPQTTSGPEHDSEWACYPPGDVRWMLDYLAAGKQRLQAEIDELGALRLTTGRPRRKITGSTKRPHAG
jgi:hypothetical protein